MEVKSLAEKTFTPVGLTAKGQPFRIPEVSGVWLRVNCRDNLMIRLEDGKVEAYSATFICTPINGYFQETE